MAESKIDKLYSSVRAKKTLTDLSGSNVPPTVTRIGEIIVMYGYFVYPATTYSTGLVTRNGKKYKPVGHLSLANAEDIWRGVTSEYNDSVIQLFQTFDINSSTATYIYFVKYSDGIYVWSDMVSTNGDTITVNNEIRIYGGMSVIDSKFI